MTCNAAHIRNFAGYGRHLYRKSVFPKVQFYKKTNLFYFLQKTSFYSYRFLCLWIFGILNGNTDLTISVKMEGIL